MGRMHRVIVALGAGLLVAACAGDGGVTGGDDGDGKGPDIQIGQPDQGASDGEQVDQTGTPDVTPDPGEPEVAEPDVLPDTGPDVTADVKPPEDIAPPKDQAVCEPNCEGKVCGSDGCGGICGYCTYPNVCDKEGQCVEVCPPQCEGKFCGPDGCGGTCGECEGDLACGDDGLCYEEDCVPDCSGKKCGSDGCGGDCGVCPELQICMGDGAYCDLGPCGTVKSTGECQGQTAVWCENKIDLKEQDCSQLVNHHCAYDGWDNRWKCMEIPECVPNCAGKVCGGDGCGGSCGACTDGWSCEVGQCKPQAGAKCGSVTHLGLCDGDHHWWCSSNVLYGDDCTKYGEKCGWLDGKYSCK